MERIFDSSKPVYAAREFRLSGRTYKHGDKLDWKRQAVSRDLVRKMFDARKLTHTELSGSDDAAQGFVRGASVDYDLDAIDDMKELRRIADEVGACYKVSKVGQRDAIREALSGGSQGE